MRIELLWFEDCPNHATAESLLRDVLDEEGIDASVERIEVPDEETGRRVRFPGSPTIRIDGQDVEPGFDDPGDYSPRCRVYATAAGLRGVPERQWIVDAVSQASS